MLATLPNALYAEIARFLGGDFPGRGFRKAAGAVQIKDVKHNMTYSNGVLHSFDDQPAVQVHGTQHWFQHGELHRDGDQPAVIRGNRRVWYQHGKKHRAGDLPAEIDSYGNQYWFQHGDYHRDNARLAMICYGTRLSMTHNAVLHCRCCGIYNTQRFKLAEIIKAYHGHRGEFVRFV